MFAMRRLPIALLVAVIPGLVVGLIVALLVRPGSSGAQDPGNDTVIVNGDSELSDSALKDASAKVGFAAKVPTDLPTSARRLQIVNTSTGPGGTGMRMLNLVFSSDVPFEAKGQKTTSSLEMFQLSVRLEHPNGELVSTNVAGFDLYRDVVDSDEVHGPIKVTYMAVRDGETLVMDFTGEQPTLEGLAKMLASLVTVK